MVVRCSNPECNREFHQLSQGRLYLLPPPQDSFSEFTMTRLADYCYWLCPECSRRYVLERQGTELILTARSLRLQDDLPAVR